MQMIIETGHQFLSIFWSEVKEASLYKIIGYKAVGLYEELENEQHPISDILDTVNRNLISIRNPRLVSQAVNRSNTKYPSFSQMTTFTKMKIFEELVDRTKLYYSVDLARGCYQFDIIAEDKTGKRIESATAKAIVYRWG